MRQRFRFWFVWSLRSLWPIVVLMLKPQLQWCPGWKFPAYVDAAVNQIELFSTEILRQVPRKIASPRLSLDRRRMAISNGLQERDLKALADGIKGELKERFKTSFPELNHTLHKCLDFGIQFNELCGQRTTACEVPVNKASFAKVGAA